MTPIQDIALDVQPESASTAPTPETPAPARPLRGHRAKIRAALEPLDAEGLLPPLLRPTARPKGSSPRPRRGTTCRPMQQVTLKLEPITTAKPRIALDAAADVARRIGCHVLIEVNSAAVRIGPPQARGPSWMPG